jgi:hypothetical protein
MVLIHIIMSLSSSQAFTVKREAMARDPNHPGGVDRHCSFALQDIQTATETRPTSPSATTEKLIRLVRVKGKDAMRVPQDLEELKTYSQRCSTVR